MKTMPTYTAMELKDLCKRDLGPEEFRTIANLINEEIDLYDEKDIELIIEVSFELLARSLISAHIKL